MGYRQKINFPISAKNVKRNVKKWPRSVSVLYFPPFICARAKRHCARHKRRTWVASQQLPVGGSDAGVNGHVEARVVTPSRGQPSLPARTCGEQRTRFLRRNTKESADSGDSGLPLGHKKLFVHVYVSYPGRPHGSRCQRIPESKTASIGPRCENMNTFIFFHPVRSTVTQLEGFLSPLKKKKKWAKICSLLHDFPSISGRSGSGGIWQIWW